MTTFGFFFPERSFGPTPFAPSLAIASPSADSGQALSCLGTKGKEPGLSLSLTSSQLSDSTCFA